MATLHVRYLVARPGAAGELPRYFWQPSSKLRAAGWQARRVPDNFADYTDAGALHAAAIAAAEAANAELDATRQVGPSGVARPPAPRSLADLVRAFQQSPAWTKLRPATQRGYRQCLEKLLAWGGEAPVRAIDPPRIQRLHQALASTPAYANAVVRVLRLLLSWGRRQGWVSGNAAERPALHAAEAGGVIWPREAVALFVDTADAMGLHSIGTAVMLNEWIGQREGDILRMPRSILRNGALVLRQSKTGKAVTLSVDQIPHVWRRLGDEFARQSARAVQATTIIVSEATGAPYRSDHFRHAFARVRARMAAKQAVFGIDYLLPGRDMADAGAFEVRATELTFMTLRHTAITRLAEAGLGAGQIAAVSGHAERSVQSIMERYMVRTAAIARLAFQQRLEAEGGAARANGDAGTGYREQR